MTQEVLPQWFREALEGEPTDNLPNKRLDIRHEWPALARIDRLDSSDQQKLTVKVFNASTQGIGFISRQPIELGERVRVAPDGVSEDGTPYEPVEAVAIYCTQTIQGYKVGCSIP